MKQLLLISLFLVIVPSAGNAQSKKYADLSVFWKDFKHAATNKDYKMVGKLTAFPFCYQDQHMTSTEFLKTFTFPEYLITALKKAQPPVKSSFGIDKYPVGSLYEVDCGGPALYFSKVAGEWRFAVVIFGE